MDAQDEDWLLDRLTEPSKVALFFARDAVSRYGGESIDVHHLMLGLVEAVPKLLLQLMRPNESVEEMKLQLTALVPAPVEAAEDVAIPLTPAARLVFDRAATEADSLGTSQVQPEHILLGLLGTDDPALGRLLIDFGIEREKILALLDQQ